MGICKIELKLNISMKNCEEISEVSLNKIVGGGDAAVADIAQFTGGYMMGYIKASPFGLISPKIPLISGIFHGIMSAVKN